MISRRSSELRLRESIVDVCLFSLRSLLLRQNWIDAGAFFVFGLVLELDDSLYQCEQRMVSPHSDVTAGMNPSAALPDDNRTRAN